MVLMIIWWVVHGGGSTRRDRTTTFENKVYCRTQTAQLQPNTEYELTPEFQVRRNATIVSVVLRLRLSRGVNESEIADVFMGRATIMRIPVMRILMILMKLMMKWPEGGGGGAG